jgi:hypothetical protein
MRSPSPPQLSRKVYEAFVPYLVTPARASVRAASQ